jgi:hypothetical protein
MSRKAIMVPILKILLTTTFSLAFLSINIQPAQAAMHTWTVDDGTVDFHTIQEAVNVYAKRFLFFSKYMVFPSNLL